MRKTIFLLTVIILICIPAFKIILKPDLEVYMQQVNFTNQSVRYILVGVSSSMWSQSDSLVQNSDYWYPDTVVLEDNHVVFTEGWNRIGSEGFFGGTIAYGLYQLSTDYSESFWYIDWRDDSLQFGVGIDIILQFNGSDGFLYAKGYNQNPDPDWEIFSSGDTIFVWKLKRGQYATATRTTFQPTTPENLSISTENNHPKLTWSASEPYNSAKYNIYRSTSYGGSYAQVNLDPVTDTHWVDLDNWTNQNPKSTYYYKIRSISGDGNISSPAFSNIASISAKLEPQKPLPEQTTSRVFTWFVDAYPNPFNPSTMIEYSIVNSGRVRLILYDITGRVLEDMDAGWREPGKHSQLLNIKNRASGTYFLSMTVRDAKGMHQYVANKKIIMTK